MISSFRYTHVTSDEDPVDFEYLHSFYNEVSSEIIDHYFRAELKGYNNIPDSGPVILISNHSGNAFPHDSFVLDQLLWRAGGLTKRAKFRPLYSPNLAFKWWMRPFGLDNWWRLFGAVDQTYINFDRILAKKERLIYYPEGIPGIGKGFNRRYRLQPFQPSFIKLAVRYNVPVIPVYGINAEWVNPVNITFKWLNKISSRLFGIPFIPLPLIILALIFPFFFYFAFPCRMKFFIGKPINISDWIHSHGGMNPEEPDRNQSESTAEEIRNIMQIELERLVLEHGNKPYHFSSLFSEFRKLSNTRWMTSPLGWPIRYTRHFRDFYHESHSNNHQNRWKRDWDLIGYYLPFGWVFLALFRKVRKPPYGTRGLTKKQKIRKEGRFVWSISRNS
ncbi:MAG: 1-acyl-sn-glycerol-3-phosphate acyltransferase [Balneolales bacterium]